MNTQTVETMDWPDVVERSAAEAVATRIDIEATKRLANRFILALLGSSMIKSLRFAIL